MAIILDIAAVLIGFISIYFAYRKGMIKTLFSLLGGIIAVVLAVNLCAPVASWVDEKFVGPAVRNTVLTAINGSAVGKDFDQAVETVDVVEKLQEMPDSLRSFLETLNVDVDGIIASAKKSQSDSVAAKEQLVSAIADPISAAISKGAALIGLVIIFFLLLFIVSRLLDTVFRVLPFGKSINRAGGLVFGVVRAGLIVLIFGAALHWLAQGNILVSTEELNHTILLKAMNQVNPILGALK